YRHHPKPFGAGEVWNSFALRYDGKAWSTPRRLGHSNNLMDNRPALAAFGQGLITVFSGDGRTKQIDRRQNELFATVLVASGPPPPPRPPPRPPRPPVPPGGAGEAPRTRPYGGD